MSRQPFVQGDDRVDGGGLFVEDGLGLEQFAFDGFGQVALSMRTTNPTLPCSALQEKFALLTSERRSSCALLAGAPGAAAGGRTGRSDGCRRHLAA
jgi:hypothetical protein